MFNESNNVNHNLRVKHLQEFLDRHKDEGLYEQFCVGDNLTTQSEDFYTGYEVGKAFMVHKIQEILKGKY